jgi:hypothetical protein
LVLPVFVVAAVVREVDIVPDLSRWLLACALGHLYEQGPQQRVDEPPQEKDENEKRE